MSPYTYRSLWSLSRTGDAIALSLGRSFTGEVTGAPGGAPSRSLSRSILSLSTLSSFVISGICFSLTGEIIILGLSCDTIPLPLGPPVGLPPVTPFKGEPSEGGPILSPEGKFCLVGDRNGRADDGECIGLCAPCVLWAARGPVEGARSGEVIPLPTECRLPIRVPLGPFLKEQKQNMYTKPKSYSIYGIACVSNLSLFSIEKKMLKTPDKMESHDIHYMFSNTTELERILERLLIRLMCNLIRTFDIMINLIKTHLS